MEVAIGDNNTNYYIRYLENAGEDSWTPSWHWPAFFVTSGWLLYRKLWLAWFLYFFALPVALIFAGVITVALGETFGAIAQTVISLVCYFVLMPMFANALYARKLRRLVATAAVHSDNREKRIQWLATHGGTSLIWMVVLIFPVVIGILAAVALPAYQDYIISSNTAKVISHYEESARYVENELGNVKSSIVMGTETLANFQATRDSAQWVADLNLEGLIAPGGGPAFATTVDHQVGIVGVVATGSVMDDPITYQVTITRPAYGDFSEQPVAARVVHWVDI
ncbi:MAG: DUF2628 domain-containing protein [Gammaproteobacteria bacterium]|nr:DUF2628 domain-containing protein [Gammaproteobacteria bacterium]